MFTFTVTPDHGEPYKVKAATRDVYVWEKAFKGKTVAQVMANPSIVDLYEIAHIAAQRQGLFSGKLQDFVSSVDIVTEDDEEPETFPPAQSEEPSSPSPSPQGSRRPSGRTRAKQQ